MPPLPLAKALMVSPVDLGSALLSQVLLQILSECQRLVSEFARLALLAHGRRLRQGPGALPRGPLRLAHGIPSASVRRARPRQPPPRVRPAPLSWRPPRALSVLSAEPAR